MYIGAFDIETTKIPLGDKKYRSHTYLIGIKFMDLYTGRLMRYKSFRNWTDFANLLKKLKEGTLLYAHNFSFEFFHMAANIKGLATPALDKDGNTKCIFVNSTHPLKWISANYPVEIRDSYKMISLSLEECGEMIKLPKLGYDYEIERFADDELSKEEYTYNERDIDITLLAVRYKILTGYIHTLQLNYTVDNGVTLLDGKPCFCDVNNNKDIPLTATAFTRKSREYFDIKGNLYNVKQRYNLKILMQDKCKDFFPDENEYNFLIRHRSGGYCHGRKDYVAECCVEECVHSYDDVSAYPFNMLMYQYPASKPTLIKCDEKSYDLIANSFPMWAGVVMFKNFVSKEKHSLISFSKCVYAEDYILDNGRVYAAKKIAFCVNSVIYKLIDLYYKYDDMCFYNLCFWEKTQSFPVSYRKMIRYLIDVKQEFKKRNRLDKSDPLYVSDERYQSTKSPVNAQYGINVEGYAKSIIIPHNDTFIFKEQSYEDIMNRKFAHILQWGFFVPEYMKKNLWTVMYIMEHNNIDVLYNDTDSLKLKGDKKKIDKIMKKINQDISDMDIGYFDYENTSDFFVTMGAKKYAGFKNGEVYSRISGLSRKANDILNELWADFSGTQKEFLELIFNDGTVWDKSCGVHTVADYDEYHEDMIYNGHLITDCGGVSIVNSDFQMNAGKTYLSAKKRKPVIIFKENGKYKIREVNA